MRWNMFKVKRNQEAQLFENRDLKPTTDIRAVFKGMLHDHLGISAANLADHVIPGSGDVQLVKGLIV